MIDDKLKLGDWNAICDICGWKFKASQLRLTWNNLRVCEADFETRNLQDVLKASKEKITIPYSSPETDDQFVAVTYAAASVGVQDNTVPTGTFNNAL